MAEDDRKHTDPDDSSSPFVSAELMVDVEDETSDSSAVMQLNTGDVEIDPPLEPAGDDKSSPQHFDIGRMIGHYKILSRLGSGGMAEVFLAEHRTLGRRVALKKLNPQFTVDKTMIQRFFQEARTVNKISHVNIVQVTEFLETDDGEVCLIMELLDGESLEEALHSGTPMPVRRVLDIAMQVADALQAVHAKGIVHRDLKPGNIFLVKSGETKDFVKLLDFGISKVTYSADALGPEHGATKAGTLLGTPAYMAPEQATAKPVDHRTDIYSFGIILYEMLTGDNPFRGASTIEVLANQIDLHPEAPSARLQPRGSIPGELDDIVSVCLEKAPEARFQSMTDVLTALRIVREKTPTQPNKVVTGVRALSSSLAGVTRSETPGMRTRRRARRRHALLLPLTVLVTLAAAVGLVSALDSQSVTTLARWATSAPHEDATPAPIQPQLAATVDVFVETEPPGAAVFVRGGGIAEGVTPFKAAFKRSAEVLTLEFRLDGYVSAKRQVGLLESSQLSVALERAVAPPQPKSPRKPPKRASKTRVKSSDADATIDPFK